MAVQNRVTAREIGRSYAVAVSGMPAARRLWISTHRDAVDLWLLTGPIDEETRRRLFDPVASMYDRFPGADMRFHVINPDEHHRFDLDLILPSDAKEIPLRPA